MIEDYLDQIVKIIPKQLAKYYNSDCCLAASRILIDILRDKHIKVNPIVVQVWIMNPIFSTKFRLYGVPKTEEAQQWLDEGAYSVIVGSRTQSKPGFWSGHLILLIKNEYLLDLTINQATRPMKNILLKPFWIKVDDINKRQDLIIEQNNCTLIYQLFREDRSFLKTHDFQNPYARSKILKECTRLLR